MRVADAIFQRLERETSAVYFVPGGGAMYLVDALGQSNLEQISLIHEQSAGYSAVFHSMTANGLGVCLTTSGPGATNAITACTAAWMDSLPVLFISGQAKTSTLIQNTGLRTRGVQEVDIISMVRPITKHAFEPLNGTDCITALDDMISHCLNGRRGPCWLSVPLDVQGMEI